jgi:hypothetical protein
MLACTVKRKFSRERHGSKELKLLTRRTKIPSQPESGNSNYSRFFSFFNRIVESTIPVPQTVNNSRLSLLRRRVSCLIK